MPWCSPIQKGFGQYKELDSILVFFRFCSFLQKLTHIWRLLHSFRRTFFFFFGLQTSTHFSHYAETEVDYNIPVKLIERTNFHVHFNFDVILLYSRAIYKTSSSKFWMKISDGTRCRRDPNRILSNPWFQLGRE